MLTFNHRYTITEDRQRIYDGLEDATAKMWLFWLQTRQYCTFVNWKERTCCDAQLRWCFYKTIPKYLTIHKYLLAESSIFSTQVSTVYIKAMNPNLCCQSGH